MKSTDWSIIITSIMDAKPPRGKDVYTYAMIKDKTGISTSTLSRLATGTYISLDYDSGVKLVSMYDALIKGGKIQK